MSLDFVTINGDKWTPGTIIKKPANKGAGRPDEYHLGFRVEGHPPGAIAQAMAHAERELIAWRLLSSEEQAKRLKAGKRAPKEWTEEQWLQDTKRKAVRTKPYEIPAAAEVCADMARKAGWTHVVVTELKREKQ